MKRLPWWFWLVPILAAVIWWPVGAYFASDDFLAMHYARRFAAVASDFFGPQYASTDVWLFYRPLITLSFWLDQAIGGPWPPTGHISNVLAHASSALLVALIWRRFLPDGNAMAAGVLWAMMPGHVGSIAWVVGRVDSHTTVWCLLAVWLCLRANEARLDGRGGSRWPAVLATAMALMSKELAFIVPPLLSLVSLVQLRQLQKAWQATWPVWLLFALYLPFRWLVLGRLGGYEASRYELLPILQGLATVLLDQGTPLRWIGTPSTGAIAPAWFLWSAGLPVAIAVLAAIASKPRLTITATFAFLLALAPMAAFLPACDNPHNLRYYYLPCIALVGVLASTNRWLVVAIALAWLWPLLAVRSAQYDADRETARMHQALLQTARTAPSGPLFVRGMPNANAAGTAVQLHFGIDRLLQPPFTDQPRQLFAWRPLIRQPGSVRLGTGQQPPFPLPTGSTWWFDEQSRLLRSETPAQLPELRIEGDVDGVLDIGSERLTKWIDGYEQLIADGTESFGLRTANVRPMVFRITLFTACGYLSCICPDHARDGAPDGWIDIVRMFAGDRTRRFLMLEQMPPASVVLPDGIAIADALVVPTTIDLTPEFPTLIEAGSLAPATMQFTPTHRARRLLKLRFDRNYASWVRAAQGR